MGGTVTVDSVLGQGTTFNIKLTLISRIDADQLPEKFSGNSPLKSLKQSLDMLNLGNQSGSAVVVKSSRNSFGQSRGSVSRKTCRNKDLFVLKQNTEVLKRNTGDLSGPMQEGKRMS